jgi:hypothetical protein
MGKLTDKNGLVHAFNALYDLATEEQREVFKQDEISPRKLEEAFKGGFYAGQAMARVELDDCHANWKKWNKPKQNLSEVDE